MYDLEYMKREINKFIDQYWGTAIGESYYNRMCNVWDNDYEGVKNIYDELEEEGYI